MRAAGFAATVAGAVRAIFARHESAVAADLRFRRLVGRRRYVEEVYSTPGRPREERGIHVSELVLHAAGSAQPWLLLAGRVYDITELRHRHPGGRTLLDGYAGIDATPGFELAGHDRAPEILARLATYDLGPLRRPPGAAGAHLDVYDAWVRTLYLAVEIANAHRADVAVRDSRTTAARPRGVLTPYAVQLAIDTHERFRANVIDDLLGAPLDGLRGLAAGAPARAILTASQPALLAALDDAVARDDADALRRLDSACRALVECDRKLLDAVTSSLRAGVQVFERGADPGFRAAGAELQAILDRIPASLRAYAHRVNRIIGALDALPRAA